MKKLGFIFCIILLFTSLKKGECQLVQINEEIGLAKINKGSDYGIRLDLKINN